MDFFIQNAYAQGAAQGGGSSFLIMMALMFGAKERPFANERDEIIQAGIVTDVDSVPPHLLQQARADIRARIAERWPESWLENEGLDQDFYLQLLRFAREHCDPVEFMSRLNTDRLLVQARVDAEYPLATCRCGKQQIAQIF